EGDQLMAAAAASGPAGSVAGAAVSPPSRVAQGAADGMIQVVWLLSAPAGAVTLGTPAPPPAWPRPDQATDPPPPVAPPDAEAAPVLPRTPQRPGAGAVSDGLLDDLTLGAALEPAWWPRAD